MEFKKYSSIENSYREKTVNIMMEYYPNEEFIVQEKIHGSNFALYIGDSGVKCAKRGGFIDDPVSFYRGDLILERYKESLAHMFKYLDVESLSLHGEIYGGWYPHGDVEKVKGVSKVQGGVFYSPNIEFITFDMKINGEYSSIDTMNALLDQVKIPRLKILKRGTLVECLEYPNEFNSNLHNLPELENNTCEGVVIKSNLDKRLPNGNRLILKNKNTKWSEKSAKKTKVEKELPEHLIKFVESGIQYVTENRLKNVLSKIGPIVEQNTAFGKIMKPFIVDSIEDFSRDNPEFLELEKSDRGLVTKKMNQEAAILIRNNLFNIIDGNF